MEEEWAAREGEADTKGKFLFFMISSGVPILIDPHCRGFQRST